MRSKLLVFLSLLILLPLQVVIAQIPNKDFSSEDKTLTFKYPSKWRIDTVNADRGIESTSFVLENLPKEQFDSPDAIMMQIYYPTKRSSYSVPGASTPTDILRAQSAGSALFIEEHTSTSADTENDEAIKEFTIDGRPAASKITRLVVGGIDASTMSIVADVGNDYYVSVTVLSFKGGFETIKKYAPIVTAIIQTVRFTPREVDSGNPDLPHVYSGPVGIWQRGTIKFYYPEKWQVIRPMGMLLLTNTLEAVDINNPKPGEVIIAFEGISEMRSSVDEEELKDQCNSRNSRWTARKMVEKLLTFTNAQIQQIKDAGITISKPIATTVNNKEIVYFYQYQEQLDRLSLLIDLGNGDIPAMTAFAKHGETRQYEKQLISIAATVEYTAKSCGNTTPTPASQ